MSKSSPLPEAPRTSLVESAIQLIRTQIESRAWKVGEKIPKEQELADMLKIGRNTVREAIRVLSHANVLEVRQGDGTYVRSNVDPAEIMRRVVRSSLRDHLELRAILETEAARLAASNRTKADVALLRRHLAERDRLYDDGPGEAFVDADIKFHDAIAQIAGNMALAELYHYFLAAARQGTLSALNYKDLPEPGNDAHVAIVDAIERRDCDAAAAAARAVIAPVIEALSANRLPKNR